MWQRIVVVALLFFALDVATLAATPVPDLVDHDGSRGVWLRSEAVEVFVGTEPKFRLLAARRPGKPSLLADSTRPQQGVRLAFMEPNQIPDSFAVGEQSAEVVERSERKLKLRLAPAVGLRYDVAVEIDERFPKVTLAATLVNESDRKRRVATWSVLSFARDVSATIVVPFGGEPRAVRRLVVPWWTIWPQPNVRFGRDAMAVDVASPFDGDAVKVGLATDAGWAAFVRGGDGLVVSAARDARAEYPEGGANITCFVAAGWCEVEHVGPIESLSREEGTTLRQTIELFDNPFGSALPTTLPSPDPDRTREAIVTSIRGL